MESIHAHVRKPSHSALKVPPGEEPRRQCREGACRQRTHTRAASQSTSKPPGGASHLAALLTMVQQPPDDQRCAARTVKACLEREELRCELNHPALFGGTGVLLPVLVSHQAAAVGTQSDGLARHKPHLPPGPLSLLLVPAHPKQLVTGDRSNATHEAICVTAQLSPEHLPTDLDRHCQPQLSVWPLSASR
jgi:hypothetical protein